MFSRIIRWSVPVSGMCRSCNKGNLLTQNKIQLDLLLVSSNTRYINSSCSLLYSKQNPKKKTKLVDNEQQNLEGEKLKNETKSKKSSKKKSSILDNEKSKVENDKLENETKTKPKTKKKSKVTDNGKESTANVTQPSIEPDKVKNDTKENAQPKDSENQEKMSDKAEHESQDKQSFEDEFDEEPENHKTEERESLFGKDMVIHSFANTQKKEKETFLECLRMYKNQPGRKIERVPFIYAALKFMDEFGVQKDLEVYKALIDVFPKEKMVPTNQFQTMFMHYPKEQYCATALLEKMEDNGVIPDPDTELLLLSIFGRHGMPLEKYWKMMYWMPKFKHLNPWPVPSPIPNDALELAKLAMKKISSIDIQSEITEFDTNDVEDSIDKTWIVSAMAPIQSELLLKHDKKKAIYVEGPFKIYVATKCVDYFTLRTDPDLTREFPIEDTDAVDKIRNPYLETKTTAVIPAPTVHEQHDSTIFANCATGKSTKDSLLSWIRLLQIKNPVIGEIPVVFRLTNYSNEKLYLECGAETPLPKGEDEPEAFEKEDKKQLLDDK